MKPSDFIFWLLFACAIWVGAWLYIESAHAHDIYTGVKDPANGHICCGGSDCSRTSYREKGAAFEFQTREGNWIPIPEDRIIFLPIPGDVDDGRPNPAHICYRNKSSNEGGRDNLFTDDDNSQTIFLYCVFIVPGGT